ncbi:MAG: hypothetical protein ACRDTG_12010 [Pseudonocardiaceae bacterium]
MLSMAIRQVRTSQRGASGRLVGAEYVWLLDVATSIYLDIRSARLG